ncbi:MAG: hypothetical protein LIV25_07085 [Olsenella sp.]|nr:hypothetical protein [Olsenella sp.]
MSRIHITSETGRLRRVLLSKPGRELENLHPFMLDEMLFRDTPFTPKAQDEHDSFADILRECGVDVLYLRDLFEQAMSTPDARKSFEAEFVRVSGIASDSLKEAVLGYYDGLDTSTFVDTVLCGIRSDDPLLIPDNDLGSLVKNDSPFVVNPIPNIYFARDSSINVGNEAIFSHMYMNYRKREPLLLRYIHHYSEYFASEPTVDLYDAKAPWTIEGGDVMVASDKVLCIGCFGRTQPGAIERVASSAFHMGWQKVLAFHLRDPHVMHLDGMLTMVSPDTFLGNPLTLKRVEVFRLTPGPSSSNTKQGIQTKLLDGGWKQALREAAGTSTVRFLPCGGDDPLRIRWEASNLASNVLAVAPGEVVAYDRNPVTLDELDRAGIVVHTFSGSELARGKGGPRCMSMPIWRDDPE